MYLGVEKVKRLIIQFNSDGTTNVDASGFKGGECTKTTEKLLQGLEVSLKHRVLKAEYSSKAEISGAVHVQE